MRPEPLDQNKTMILGILQGPLDQKKLPEDIKPVEKAVEVPPEAHNQSTTRDALIAQTEMTENKEPSIEETLAAVEEFVKNLPTELQFRKDETAGQIVFRIVNPLTKEVLKEYPPKEIVEMAKRLRQLSEQSDKTGMLMDTET